ncbi:MAG: hypothetical protein ACTHJ0_06140 [Flavipsychrobacter sp.]
MAELSLWLDSYDDIYSDFDSRHYLKRRISEDFIDELRMSLKYRPDNPDTLQLLLPAQVRNAEIEKEILSSIKEQFRERMQIYEDKRKRTWLQGLSLLISGMILMAADAYIVYKASYFNTLLKVAMEPASWFMIWTGLDVLIYDYRKTRSDADFYKCLHQLHIHFRDIKP